MYIYEGKVFVGENLDADEELKNKALMEMLLFTPNSKPLIKNVNVFESDEEYSELSDKLPDGTGIFGKYDGVDEEGKDLYEVEAGNIKTESPLNPIELPTIDLEEIIYVPQTMTVGDMPVFVGYPEEKELFNKIEYTYEEEE